MCKLIAGKTKVCRKGFGGMDGAIIGEIENIDSVTISNGVVTAMTMKTGERAWSFDVEDETSNLGEVVNVNRANRTVVSTQTLSLMNNDYETATRNVGQDLTIGNYFVIGRYNDGNWKIAGLSIDKTTNEIDLDLSGGLSITTETHNSGTTKEDKNGDDWVFEGKENIKMLSISKDIANSLLVVVS